MYHRVVLVLALLATFALTSCVTSIENKQKLADTTLLVGQSGKTATLKWKTDKRFIYTVLYAPKRRNHAQWKPLPGAMKIRGTGSDITIQDQLPAGETRRYRLHVEYANTRR